MIRGYTRKRMAWLAVLVLTVNLLVLLRVAYNRSEVVSELVLTEREFAASVDRTLENSGVALRLQVRVVPDEIRQYVGATLLPQWLDEAKMQSLGIKTVARNRTEQYPRKVHPGKDIYLALEYDGDAYQQTLKRVENWYAAKLSDESLSENDKRLINNRLDRERRGASRLFAIDAAIELTELQEKHAHAANVFFTQAVIKPRNYFDDEQGPAGYLDLSQMVRLHIPKPDNAAIRALPPYHYDEIPSPRYEVTFKVGTLLEPWVERVSFY